MRLEVVKGDRFARTCALKCELSALMCAIYAVQHCHDVMCVWVGFLDRSREERARKRALLDVCAFSEPSKPGCVLGVERDVESLCGSLHLSAVYYTIRHGLCRSEMDPTGLRLNRRARVEALRLALTDSH
jgi:hypothetical protein